MKKLVALFLLFGPFAAHAQAPAPAGRTDSAIHLNVVPNGRYSRAFYTVNQEPLTNGSLKKLLNRYPPAATELRKDRAQRLWGLGLLPVMAVAFLVAKQQSDRQKKWPGRTSAKPRSRSPSYWAPSLATAMLSSATPILPRPSKPTTSNFINEPVAVSTHGPIKRGCRPSKRW